MPKGTANFIFTFPPEDEKSLDNLKDLMEFGDHALPGNGAMVVMVNGQNVLKVASLLTEKHGGLRFNTEMDYRYGDPPSTLGRGHKMQLRRRSLLVFGKLGFRLADGEDAIQLPPRDGGDRPNWDPRLDLGAKLVIQRFAGPGSVVCDPILGDRSDFAAGAVMAVCTFIGAFPEQSCVNRALAKLGRQDLLPAGEMSPTPAVPEEALLPRQLAHEKLQPRHQLAPGREANRDEAWKRFLPAAVADISSDREGTAERKPEADHTTAGKTADDSGPSPPDSDNEKSSISSPSSLTDSVLALKRPVNPVSLKACVNPLVFSSIYRPRRPQGLPLPWGQTHGRNRRLISAEFQ